MRMNVNENLTSPRSSTLPGSHPCAGVKSRRQGKGFSALMLFVTLITLLLPPSAIAAVITTFGQIYSHITLLDSASIDVLKVERTPSTLKLLRYSVNGTDFNLSPTEYSSSGSANGPFTPITMTPVYNNGPLLDLSQPVPLATSDLFHHADTIFIQLTDADQNLSPSQIESLLITLTSSTDDSEVLRLYETGINTGVFVGYITSTSATVTVNNGALSIALQGTITARYADAVDQSDTTASVGLFDPIGTVFDSSTGLPVDGVTISIVDAAGQPAQVFGDDGVGYPATVVSGGFVLDDNGRRYDFPPGGYRFPLMNTGSYRLIIQPPLEIGRASCRATVYMRVVGG